MDSVKLFLIFSSLSLFFIPTNANNQERILHNESYCDKARDNANFNLIHVSAVGNNDTLHFVYSSIGSFAVLTALTSKSAKLSVNCSALTSSNNSGAVFFNEPSEYSFIIVFSKLYEFFDADDKVDIRNIPNDNITAIPFGDFSWNDVEFTASESNDVEIIFSVLNSDIVQNLNKSLKFKLSVFGNEGRAGILPHLMHTPNSTQLELILDKFPINYEKPRFAVELFLVGILPDTNFTLTSSRSLDDEFTPGVFELIQLWSSAIQNGNVGGFIQWKPTVYTSETHVRENSTQTHETGLIFNDMKHRNQSFTNSLANAFYGTNLDKSFAQAMNITFGMEGDEFYSSTNYSSWTISVGYGNPPEDKISTLIIIIIAVGLGVPFVILLGGGIFLLYKRYKRRKDDLLLND